MDLPNTIIITVPGAIRDKIPIPPRAPRYPCVMDVNSRQEEENNRNTKSRKRKLENLSSDEKLLRKKMKNRVAAQTSRDKKKARMDELEAMLQEMKQKTEQLSVECQKLRRENEALRSENSKLRLHNKKGNSAPDANTPRNCQIITSRGTHNVGPAASSDCDPLLKGRDPRLAMAWQAWCCAWGLLLLTSATQGQGQNNLQPAQLCSFLPALPQLQSSSLETLSAQQKWWGPHQSTWNPVKS